MLKKVLFAGATTLFAGQAMSHHANCVTTGDDLITCGAHSGAVEFNLQNYGQIKESTRQVVLCNNAEAKVNQLRFTWVESADASTHRDMEGLKFSRISPNCTLIGGLNFTPPADFKDEPQNAWRLEINVDGFEVPSSLYVEAQKEEGQ